MKNIEIIEEGILGTFAITWCADEIYDWLEPACDHDGKVAQTLFSPLSAVFS